MELRVSQNNSYNFENKEYLRNRAKDILNRQGASKEAMESIFEKSDFIGSSRYAAESQLAVLKAATQISLNASLKETLNNIKKGSAKKAQKQPVLGELWELFTESRFDDNEIFEPVLDEFAENIFAAA